MCRGKMSRGKHDIYRDVLNLCGSANCISMIMSKCNLSGWQAKQLIPLFLAKGFIKAEKTMSCGKGGIKRSMIVYKTTELGTVLLLALENVDYILKAKLHEKCSIQGGLK